MTDDFSVFWRNDERASALFYDLLARSEQDAYDDNFLAQLAAYREAAPTSERADIFAAKYLLHHGDVAPPTKPRAALKLHGIKHILHCFHCCTTHKAACGNETFFFLTL